MKYWVFLICVFFVFGCSTGSRNPNILSKEPYNQVKYVPHVKKGMKKVRSISVTKRGGEANILSSIPALYERALKEKARSTAADGGLYLSGINVKNFTKREMFNVPYQTCKTVNRSERVPYQDCQYVSAGAYGNRGSYGTTKCTTRYRTENRSKQECTTRYKQEMRNVLYQTVSGSVYR